MIGTAGVLICGPSGVGKTRLALDLIEAVETRGGFAALVADDRVLLAARHGRLIARPPAALSGLIEVRGVGILRVPHEPAAVVRLVVDLAGEPPPRMAEAGALAVQLCGLTLPRLTVVPGPGTRAVILAAARPWLDFRATQREACVCSAT